MGRSVAMLEFLVGGKNAHAVLYDGTMYSAQAALQLGMIDQVSSDEELVGKYAKSGNAPSGQRCSRFS